MHADFRRIHPRESACIGGFNLSVCFVDLREKFSRGCRIGVIFERAIKRGPSGGRIAQPEINLRQKNPRQFEPWITLQGAFPERNGSTVVTSLGIKRTQVDGRNNLGRSRA